MEIRELTEGEVLVLVPEGRVAGSEDTNALESRLAAALKAGVRRIVLDCAVVGQLGSAAIKVLLMTSHKLGRLKGRLVLCELSAKVKKTFSISGFDKDFTIVATRAEAMQRALDPVQTGPVRVAKASSSKAVPGVKAPVPPPDDQQPPLPALPATSVAVDRTPPIQSVARSAVVVSGPPPPPVPDRREALASALLDALGVPSRRPDAVRGTRMASANLAALASGMLAALRVGRM
jgi:anti-anti-sigma factor